LNSLRGKLNAPLFSYNQCFGGDILLGDIEHYVGGRESRFRFSSWDGSWRAIFALLCVIDVGFRAAALDAENMVAVVIRFRCAVCLYFGRDVSAAIYKR